AHSCSPATVRRQLLFGSSSGDPATFGIQAPARRARCSGIFGRTWLWPLAFFSSFRDRCVLGRTVFRPSNDSIASLSTHTGTRTAVSSESSPIVAYWHIWTDADGISHQSRCELTDFRKAPIQPAAAPQWIGAEMRHDATVFVTVLPVGWIGDWHEN